MGGQRPAKRVVGMSAAMGTGLTFLSYVLSHALKPPSDSIHPGRRRFSTRSAKIVVVESFIRQLRTQRSPNQGWRCGGWRIDRVDGAARPRRTTIVAQGIDPILGTGGRAHRPMR